MEGRYSASVGPPILYTLVDMPTRLLEAPQTTCKPLGDGQDQTARRERLASINGLMKTEFRYIIQVSHRRQSLYKKCGIQSHAAAVEVLAKHYCRYHQT